MRVSLASLMAVLVILPTSVWGDWTNHIVISEIQADSINGSGGTLDDWIELYNPTDQPVDLTNWRIERTQTASDPSILIRIGNTNDGSFPGGTTIPAHGFYLIVRDDANENLKSIADAIGTRSEFNFTGNGYTIYLATGAVSSPDDPDIVDTVGWGITDNVKYYEGSPASEIPEGKSLERKGYGGSDPNANPNYGNGWDTNDNSSDFVIQTSPNPQSSSGSEEPFITATVGTSPTSFTIGSETIAVIAFTGSSSSITIYPYPGCFPPYLASQGTKPVKRFLKIEGAVPAGQTATLRVYYDQAEFDASDIPDENTTHLGRWTGTMWEYHPASSRDISGNWVETEGITQFSIWGIGGQDASLPVVLSSFVAERRDNSTIIRWSTESEVGIVGWNVYRESKDGWVKINSKLIPSKGEMGGRYEFLDPKPSDNPRRYMIEWVNLKGERERSEPITLGRSGRLKAITWAEVKTK